MRLIKYVVEKSRSKTVCPFEEKMLNSLMPRFVGTEECYKCEYHKWVNMDDKEVFCKHPKNKTTIGGLETTKSYTSMEVIDE